MSGPRPRCATDKIRTSVQFFLLCYRYFQKNGHSPSGCEPESLVAPRELGECARWGEESLNEFKTICFVLQSLSSDLGLHFHHSALGWMFLCRGEPEQGYVLVLGRWGLRRLGYP